ncbi:RNA polymerase sigma-70 factor, ECF subfamily [Asanoa ishikariensis]|uniref:RNA polymerase sigma-70 factor, ECF subfamily n=2 Tax=Asanoa ishikariensis TaxID=137265 RepID=A0A1H3URS8_9ACTN|nr:RNA polymerase sigma-70 factor, ECF subfamily [Asanoa ishikariensis]
MKARAQDWTALLSHRELIHDLYVASYQRLVLQLYPVTGDLGEAQEVVQEAFVKLLAAPSQVSTLGNPEAWLRTAAVNLARTRRRRGKVLQRLLGRAGTRSTDVPGASPDHVALMAALLTLPTGQREAIALHYLADLPITEVADLLKVSAGTVKSRLSRGRTALSRLLRESAPDDKPERVFT